MGSRLSQCLQKPCRPPSGENASPLTSAGRVPARVASRLPVDRSHSFRASLSPVARSFPAGWKARQKPPPTSVRSLPLLMSQTFVRADRAASNLPSGEKARRWAESVDSQFLGPVGHGDARLQGKSLGGGQQGGNDEGQCESHVSLGAGIRASPHRCSLTYLARGYQEVRARWLWICRPTSSDSAGVPPASGQAPPLSPSAGDVQVLICTLEARTNAKSLQFRRASSLPALQGR
jgi:hypothetical protein